MLVSTYEPTRCYNPEEQRLHGPPPSSWGEDIRKSFIFLPDIIFMLQLGGEMKTPPYRFSQQKYTRKAHFLPSQTGREQSGQRPYL
jgi:hypothetical protein